MRLNRKRRAQHLPDASHGGIFQYYPVFVEQILTFLR